MDKRDRFRIITKIINNGVQDRETRHRLYKEQNRLRVDISHEITRRMDLEILEGLKREKEGNNAV